MRRIVDPMTLAHCIGEDRSELESWVAERRQLEAALDCVKDGDQFVCTKLDRLAGSVGDLLAIVARLGIGRAGVYRVLGKRNVGDGMAG